MLLIRKRAAGLYFYHSYERVTGYAATSIYRLFNIIVLLNRLIQLLMIVFVNNVEISIFSGARVRDALRAYYRSIQQDFPFSAPITLDQYGNIIELNGEVSQLKRIYTIESEALNQKGNYENF